MLPVMLPVPAWASPSGRLAGRVSDERGRALAGATLTLTGPGTAGLRLVTTDTRGFYQFQGIPTREPLDLRASAPGKEPLIFTGLRAREEIAARLDIRLRPPDWKVVLVALDPRVPYHQVARDGAATALDVDFRTLELQGDPRADADALRAALQERPNAVLAIGSDAARLARREIRDLPVVYTMALDPEGEGFEAANLCGTQLNGAFGDQLSVLASLSEGAATIATIYDPRRLDRDVRALERAGRQHGMRLTALPARSAADARACLRTLERGRHDAFVLLMDPQMIDPEFFASLREIAARQRMILIVPDSSLVAAGGTFSYGPGFHELGAYAGRTVGNILRGAATPAALGRVYPTTRYLAVNTLEARRLGLSLPESLLPPSGVGSGEADQVLDQPRPGVQAPEHGDLEKPQRPR